MLCTRPPKRNLIENLYLHLQVGSMYLLISYYSSPNRTLNKVNTKQQETVGYYLLLFVIVTHRSRLRCVMY